jgi:hypothetical protein
MKSYPVPDQCPICGAETQRLEGDWWRCPVNSGHYWAWRDQQSGHAIRNFLTQPHPNKLGAFYTVSREALLRAVTERAGASATGIHLRPAQRFSSSIAGGG